MLHTKKNELSDCGIGIVCILHDAKNTSIRILYLELLNGITTIVEQK